MNTNLTFTGLFMLMSLLSATVALADDEQASVATIEVTAARGFVSEHEDAVILDVRSPAEYEMSHITGSVNVNVLDESFKNMAMSLDPKKTYIVHCTKNPTGGRSSRALETLQVLGFENLFSLEGGIVAWEEAELPLTESSN